ncbi:MAG: 50S ribosomal protein L19 [Candidatus Moranbacteria bacterium]|nr:50S ribosomal protein L19 [Candidatus Moranbacteria bacterium]
MEKIYQYNRKVRQSRKCPDLKSGDIVKIHRKIKEGDKERIQIFEGIIVSIKGKQSSSPMVTVRRVSFGTGVEITVPLYSPAISKIEVVKRAKVRRSKLYYLREKGFRLSKLKMKELGQFVAEEKEPEAEKQESEEKKGEQPKKTEKELSDKEKK